MFLAAMCRSIPVDELHVVQIADCNSVTWGSKLHPSKANTFEALQQDYNSGTTCGMDLRKGHHPSQQDTLQRTNSHSKSAGQSRDSSYKCVHIVKYVEEHWCKIEERTDSQKPSSPLSLLTWAIWCPSAFPGPLSSCSLFPGITQGGSHTKRLTENDVSLSLLANKLIWILAVF